MSFIETSTVVFGLLTNVRRKIEMLCTRRGSNGYKVVEDASGDHVVYTLGQCTYFLHFDDGENCESAMFTCSGCHGVD